MVAILQLNIKALRPFIMIKISMISIGALLNISLCLCYLSISIIQFEIVYTGLYERIPIGANPYPPPQGLTLLLKTETKAFQPGQEKIHQHWTVVRRKDLKSYLGQHSMLPQVDIHSNLASSHPLCQGCLHSSYIPLPAYRCKTFGDRIPVFKYNHQPHYIQFTAAGHSTYLFDRCTFRQLADKPFQCWTQLSCPFLSKEWRQCLVAQIAIIFGFF